MKMTDRDFLLLFYGALRALQVKNLQPLLDELQSHLFPPPEDAKGR